MKRVKCIFIVTFLFAVFSSFGVYSIEWIGGDDETTEGESDDPQTAGEMLLRAVDGDMALYFNDATCELIYTNKAENQQYTSFVTQEEYGSELDQNLIKEMGQIIKVVYASKKEGYTGVFTNDSGNVKKNLSSLDKGFKLTLQCDIDGTEGEEPSRIEISVCFTLDDGRFKVTIPYSGIREDGGFSVISVDVLPYFGATPPGVDGYIVYPDGCGTLYRFKEKANIRRLPVTKMLYSENYNTLDEYIASLQTEQRSLTMPVFGITREESALFAIVNGGDADTSLTLAPGGYIYDLNRVFPTFHYRYNYYYTTVNKDQVILFEEDSVKNDFEITYVILPKDQATYSGMASYYREYLLKNNRLNHSALQPSVSIDLLMTTRKNVLFWQDTKVITTFKEAEKFLDALNKRGIDGALLNLLGWQDGGYNHYPAHMPVSGAAGGTGGLKSLAAAAADGNNYIFLSDNYLEADGNTGGYSKRSDTAYNTAKKPLATQKGDKFLMDLKKGVDFFKKTINKARNYGISGFNLPLTGELLYNNMAPGRVQRRQEMTTGIGEFLMLGKTQFGAVMAGGANAYVFPFADYIAEMPESSSREFLYDQDIPLVQMVLHGYVPYGGAQAGNFSDSFRQTELFWLEYGLTPHFVLGAQSAKALKDTLCEGVFMSRLSDWQDKIQELDRTFFPAYKQIADKVMLLHESKGQVRRVTYGDGTVLLINYGSAEAHAFDRVLAPESYELVMEPAA